VPLIDTIGHTVPAKTILVQLGQLTAVGFTVNLIAVLVMFPVKGPVPASGDSKLNVPLMLPAAWTMSLSTIAPDSAAVVLWAEPL
jgi:hypothetical protein